MGLVGVGGDAVMRRREFIKSVFGFIVSFTLPVSTLGAMGESVSFPEFVIWEALTDNLAWWNADI